MKTAATYEDKLNDAKILSKSLVPIAEQYIKKINILIYHDSKYINYLLYFFYLFYISKIYNYSLI